jgi:hypothetical protein
MRTLLLALLLPILAPLPQGGPGPGAGSLTFERYHTVEGIASNFAALAASHPRWFRTEELGRSFLDRPIPLLAISDFEHAGEKRGMWVDGAIHGGELASAEPPLALVEELRARIVAGEPPAWLQEVVVYVVPVIHVDGRHASMTPPYPYQRKNLRPRDDDGDGLLDEDGPADLNGDGRVSRVLGVARALEARDADGDGRCGEDPPGGWDLNRDFPVARAERPEGWQPQPETAAVVAFWERHPEIALAFSYHTSARVLIHPPVEVTVRQGKRYERVSELYREHVRGGVWDDREALEGLVGTTMEWFHSARGAIAMTVEIELPQRPGELPQRAHETVVHPCLGAVEVERVEAGYPGESQNRLERRLPELVAPQVELLLRAAAELAGWEPRPEGR